MLWTREIIPSIDFLYCVQMFNVFQEYNGWRKNEVPTVVVILTDGKAQDAELIPTIARKLRSKVTKVIAVGVGKADESELELIATRPFDENVIYIGEFSSLTSLVIRLASQVGNFWEFPLLKIICSCEWSLL